MQSLELIRDNLNKSSERVLARIDDMRDHGLVVALPGGAHTLWVLGHLACIEALVVREFMAGEPNPLADWRQIFDGDRVGEDPALFPPFDEVLARCREERARTLSVLDTLAEHELDLASAKVPAGYADSFGTRRLCLQYAADHWYMHRGHLADARRAAGIDRMWV